MNNFSLIDTVFSGLKDYAKHWGLVVCASALVSSAWLLRPVLSPLQNIKPNLPIALFSQVQSDQKQFSQQVEAVASEMEQKATKYRPLARVVDLILYMLCLFLELGFIKLCLDLIDKGKGSLRTLISQGAVYQRAFGASVLAVIILVAVGVVLLLLGGVLLTLCPNFTRTVVVVNGILDLAVMLALITPFIFFKWCIVDQGSHIIQSFLCSWERIKPQKYKLALLLFALFIFNAFVQKRLMAFISVILQKVLPMSFIAYTALNYFIVSSLFVMPLTHLILTRVYRALA